MDFRVATFINFYEQYISHSEKANDLPIHKEGLSENQEIRYKQLITYAQKNIDEIVLYIDQNATNWKFSRINSVEKVCLILGTAELSMKLTKKEIIIAEWVKLADKHSSSEGAKFVNGVLEKINEDLNI